MAVVVSGTSSVTPSTISYLRSQGITTLYHFTDRSNIQSIINNGGLYSWSACQKKGITISRPGGSDTSRSLDSRKGLENYVRLSFTRNHPMMYVAKKEGRIWDPVILEISLSVVSSYSTKFSDRNATKNGAIIARGYDGAKNIHFSTVKQYTHFDLIESEKEFYQAEVLVLEHVPLSFITNIDLFKPKPKLPPSYPPYAGRMEGSGSSTTYRPSTYSSSSSSSSSSANQSGGAGCLLVIIGTVIILVIAAICG